MRMLRGPVQYSIGFVGSGSIRIETNASTLSCPRQVRAGCGWGKVNELCRVKLKNDGGEKEGEEDDEDREDVVRRWLVFFALSGIASIGVKIWGVRQLNELDTELKKWFPFLRDKIVPRNPLDQSLAQSVLDVTRNVAVKRLKLLTAQELDTQAEIIENRARKFFEPIPDDPKDLDDVGLFNLQIYALYHVIAEQTSVKRLRLDFVYNVGDELYQQLRSSNTSNLKSIEKKSLVSPRNPTPILEGINEILTTYTNCGFCSGFKVDLNALEETLWQEEGAANLVVFVNDLVTITATQLLAGEEYDDTAPVITTPILLAFFKACNLGITYEVQLRTIFMIVCKDYYIDNTYQNDPAKYRPSGVVSTFDVQTRTS